MQRDNFQLVLTVIVVVAIVLLLTGCGNTMTILDGATHAKGSAHVEGVFTDSQADVDLCKVPADYSVEQAAEYCHGE